MVFIKLSTDSPIFSLPCTPAFRGNCYFRVVNLLGLSSFLFTLLTSASLSSIFSVLLIQLPLIHPLPASKFCWNFLSAVDFSSILFVIVGVSYFYSFTVIIVDLQRKQTWMWALNLPLSKENSLYSLIGYYSIEESY